MKPLVSICINTYNRGHLISNTIQSVLNQTFKNFEIIIVDDCSNDETEGLIQHFIKNDYRIRYIRHKKRQGLAIGRNTAIFNAKGVYFTFCDDDDLWLPTYISNFINIAKSYDDQWIFCCGNIYKDSFGRNVSLILNYEGKLSKLIKKGFTPPVSAQFYKLSTLIRIDGYNNKIKSGVDHDLWIRLSILDVNIKYIPLALSLPNSEVDFDRMTMNYESRISGILDSLQIWKKDLITFYGQDFFLNFSKAYLLREKVKFLNYFIKEFDLKKIYNIQKSLKFNIFFKETFFAIIKIIIKLLLPKISYKDKSLEIKPTLKIISK